MVHYFFKVEEAKKAINCSFYIKMNQIKIFNKNYKNVFCIRRDETVMFHLAKIRFIASVYNIMLPNQPGKFMLPHKYVNEVSHLHI